MKTAIDEWKRNHQQINFTVDAVTAKKLERVLKARGAIKSETGRWVNTGEVFAEIIDSLDYGTTTGGRKAA